MTTDNRMSEPNKYAGFIARQNHQRERGWRGVGALCLCGKVFDLDADHAMHQVEAILEAALVAAQGAAPQAESEARSIQNPDNLEIMNGWLVERGVHEAEYPAGAAYGPMPGSDAEPLLNLADVPGYPVQSAEAVERVNRLHRTVLRGDELTAWCAHCEVESPCLTMQALAPVQPSSTLDEDALTEVIESLGWGYMVDGPSVSEIARAVAEWLKEQRR